MAAGRVARDVFVLPRQNGNRHQSGRLFATHSISTAFGWPTTYQLLCNWLGKRLALGAARPHKRQVLLPDLEAMAKPSLRQLRWLNPPFGWNCGHLSSGNWPRQLPYTNQATFGYANHCWRAQPHANAKANPNAIATGLHASVNGYYRDIYTIDTLSLGAVGSMRNKKQGTTIKIIRVLLVLFILLAFIQDSPGISYGLPSEGPQRSVTISTDYTIYEWWLMDWKNSNLVCQVYTEDEGIPDYSEVLHYCGAAIQKRWIETKPCVYEGDINKPSDCPGLYMHLVHTTPSKGCRDQAPSPEFGYLSRVAKKRLEKPLFPGALLAPSGSGALAQRADHSNCRAN